MRGRVVGVRMLRPAPASTKLAWVVEPGSGVAVGNVDGGEGVSSDALSDWAQIFELAEDADDAGAAAYAGQGHIAVHAERGFLLTVHGVAGEGRVGAEAIEVLHGEVEADGIEVEIAVGVVDLASVAVVLPVSMGRMGRKTKRYCPPVTEE